MLNPIINHSYLLIWARRQSLSGRTLKPVYTHGRPLLSAGGNGTQQHLLTLRNHHSNIPDVNYKYVPNVCTFNQSPGLYLLLDLNIAYLEAEQEYNLITFSTGHDATAQLPKVILTRGLILTVCPQQFCFQPLPTL